MNANVDLTNVQLETERLILRAWKESDLEDFYEYASVDGVGQLAGWQPHESIEKSKEILTLFIEEKKTFALVYKENNKVIGSLGLEGAERHEPEEFKNMLGREIGYVLSKDYWGKGLMPEAVKRVIEYCFLEEGYDFLMCGHFIRNNQSARVIEKSGFEEYAEEDYETRIGTVERTKMYCLTNKLLTKEAREQCKTIKVQMKDHGNFAFRLMAGIAPIAIKRLLKVIEMKKFDGKVIERLEPGFVIQPLFQDGVDKEVDVMVEPEFRLNLVNHTRNFTRGIVAMAGDGENASGCQFFVTLDRHERLDGNFTVIGVITDGWEEIERLEQVNVVECIDDASGFTYHKPEKDEIIERVTVE